MTKPKPELSAPKLQETALLPRNFTITTAEQMRALAGPPPYALRLRRIEDLEAAILATIAAHEAKQGAPLDAARLPTIIQLKIDQLNALIGDHNRYYPIEARLRIDVRTRQLMDWDRPWVPMAMVTAKALLARARRP
ncbi:Hypothetical protein A7982_10647 [Minicystis rosea]|nr:Hypothetical protein A7982_10647 [Minicystis rosea]